MLLNLLDTFLSDFLNSIDNRLKYTSHSAHVYYQSDQDLDHRPIYRYLSNHIYNLLLSRNSKNNELCSLELGCGTGRYFSSITELTSIVGIDINSSMLNYAKQVSNVNNLDLYCIDTMSYFLNNPACKFDLIYSFGVFVEHAPFSLDLLNTILLHLKPGGTFTFTVYVGGLRRTPFFNLLLDKFSRLLAFIRLPLSAQFFSRDCELDSIISSVQPPFTVLSSSLLPASDQTWNNSHRLITIKLLSDQ